MNVEDIILSGPKVDSFRLNLNGDSFALTFDTWMAIFGGVSQSDFSGKRTKGWTDPGKNSMYLAFESRFREAAEILSKKTGFHWEPAEVQDTVWSLCKTLMEYSEASDTALKKHII